MSWAELNAGRQSVCQAICGKSSRCVWTLIMHTIRFYRSCYIIWRLCQVVNVVAMAYAIVHAQKHVRDRSWTVKRFIVHDSNSNNISMCYFLKDIRPALLPIYLFISIQWCWGHSVGEFMQYTALHKPIQYTITFANRCHVVDAPAHRTRHV